MGKEQLDLLGLASVAAICAILVSLCYAFDKLLLQHQRYKISDRLASWWLRIEAVDFSTLPRIVASSFLDLEKVVLGAKHSRLRVVITCISLSIVASTLCMFFGEYLWYGEVLPSIGNMPDYKLYLMYPLNLVFDAITLAATTLIMILISRTSVVLALLLVIIDIIFAFILAAVVFDLSHTLFFWGTSPTTLSPSGVDFNLVRTSINVFLGYWERAGLFDWDDPMMSAIREATNDWLGPWYTTGGEWGSFFLANTTLIPTATFLMLFGLMILYIIAFQAGRALLLQLFALDVETEKSVIFYTGVLISVVSLGTKLLIELGKLTSETPA